MSLNRVDDIFMLQVRLFMLAQKRWNKDVVECERIFEEYEINDYIKTSYEDFHVQGDEASILDIEEYLRRKGANI